ncbi:MAG TPA: hypothetical protein VGM90_20855 [Kofleriaceae bacterium]|jgi:hypothetical protein
MRVALAIALLAACGEKDEAPSAQTQTLTPSLPLAHGAKLVVFQSPGDCSATIGIAARDFDPNAAHQYSQLMTLDPHASSTTRVEIGHVAVLMDKVEVASHVLQRLPLTGSTNVVELRKQADGSCMLVEVPLGTKIISHTACGDVELLTISPDKPDVGVTLVVKSDTGQVDPVARGVTGDGLEWGPCQVIRGEPPVFLVRSNAQYGFLAHVNRQTHIARTGPLSQGDALTLDADALGVTLTVGTQTSPLAWKLLENEDAYMDHL